MGGKVTRVRGGEATEPLRLDWQPTVIPFLVTPLSWVKRMSEALSKLWHRVDELEEKLNLVIAAIQYPHLREQILERLNATIDREG